MTAPGARFLRRVRAPRPWGYLAFSASRLTIGLALAAAPALALGIAAILAPPAFRDALTDHENVRETFARFISAIATASAIAVSVTALALGRELRGLDKLRERHDETTEHRRRVREAASRDGVPLGLAPFLAVSFEAVEEAARAVHRAADERALATHAARTTLGEHLAAIEEAATRAAHDLALAGPRPSVLVAAALDFEFERTTQVTRRFARESTLPQPVREKLDALNERLVDAAVGTHYAKTLDVQWGLSRMAMAVLLTTIPALGASAAMSLTYGDGAVAAWGVGGAVALVLLTLAVTLLPVGAIVSGLMRFVFLNQYTLPEAGFVLGPEQPSSVEREPSDAGAAGAAKRRPA